MNEDLECDNELMHYGVLGMKWGIRRYQPKTSNGKTKNKKNIGKKASSSVKKVKRKNKDLEKKKELEKQDDNRKREIDKQMALKTGNIKDVMKYRYEYSNKELEEAIKRIELETKINKMNPSKKTFDKIDDVMKKVGKIQGWTKTGIEIYKNLDELEKLYKSYRRRRNST